MRFNWTSRLTAGGVFVTVYSVHVFMSGRIRDESLEKYVEDLY